MKPFLHIDDHTSLHLARPELAEPLFRAIDSQRAYLRQWLPWVDGTRALQDTENYLRQSMADNAKGVRLITFLLHEGQVGGSLSVVHFNRDFRSAEIGYWLRQDLQGQGIMTRACRGFIQHLFRNKNLHRVELRAAAANQKSQLLARRLGFVHEGTLRQALPLYGEWFDMEIFGLLRADWQP